MSIFSENFSYDGSFSSGEMSINSSDLDVSFFFFIFLVMGVAFIALGFYLMKKKRFIENIPTSRIRGLAMGLAEIKGSVKSIELFKSPFTQKDCIYYEYVISEFIPSGKSRGWKTVVNDNEVANFFIEDGTGKVLVNPNGATFELSESFSYEQNANDILPQNIIFSLEQLRQLPQDEKIPEFFRNAAKRQLESIGRRGRIKIIERLIAPGDQIYVLGTAGQNSIVVPGTAIRNEDNILMQKGKSFFHISNLDERDITKSLTKTMIAFFVLGSIMTLAAFVVFI